MEILAIAAIIVLAVIFLSINRNIAQIKDDLYEIKIRLRELGEDASASDGMAVPQAAHDDEESLPEPENSETVSEEHPTLGQDIEEISPVTLNCDDKSKERTNLPEPPSYQPVTKKKGLNIESLVGENIFGKIGILALVIGVGFFVKFAIDNNWINEAARTVLGILTGVCIWAIAYRLRERYRSFSSVLAGGGFAICFVTVAVAYNFYRLFPEIVTLAIFVALSIVMIVMALRYDRRELAMTAIVGGYAAPFLASGDNGGIIMLLVYTALLSVAVFVITLRRDWWELIATATVITWIIVGVAELHADAGTRDALTILVFSTFFFTLFSFPLVTVLGRDTNRSVIANILLMLSVVNPCVYLGFGIHSAECVTPLANLPGIVPAYMSLVYAGIYFRYYHRKDEGFIRAFMSWCVIASAALIIPVQFSSPRILTVGFSLYSLLLMGIFVKTGRVRFVVASVIVMIAGLGSLLEMLALDDTFFRDSAATSWLLSGISYLLTAILVDKNWSLFGKIGNSLRLNLYGITLNIGCGLVAVAVSTYAGIHCSENIDSFCTVTMLLILITAYCGRLTPYTSGFMPLWGLTVFASGFFCGRASLQVVFHWISAVLYGVALAIFIVRVFRDNSIDRRSRKAVYFSLISAIFMIMCVLYAIYAADHARYFSAGLSIGLIAAGALLMVAGLRYRVRAVRIVSLSLFAVLLVKLVAYDLWRLPMLGRIIVFLLLGGVLLSLSFLYQKLSKSLFAGDKESE